MDSALRQAVSDDRPTSLRVFLGPLEEDVMDVVWRLGLGNVREVAGQMERNLAYTTVMTTLDRLYKKGMLDREMTDRAFIYSAKVTREEWDRQRAGEMMAGFLAGPEESRQLLLSCLVDAVGTHDALLLDELERKIREKREELAKAR
ncbi:MAG TPA: BlaI/MecI/CopY family transcriptional regulator [Candidatus Angelobacter sp.]|jgi:predicted transcriptional regulator|nr:BlaI/MecI/CopY family transcriptional regulator [Candidatus Angelobacter sp.]